MSCKEIQRGWGSGKGQKISLRSKPTAQQLFGLKEHRHQPCDMALARSTDPLSSCCCCCPTLLPVLQGRAHWAQGRVDLPPHPHPTILLLCMHHGGETALISWLWLGVLWLWAVQGRSSPSSPPDQLQASTEGN